MIRFGTNPIAWSNDDDQSLGAHISLEQCLREASEIGFDGIENGNKFPSDPNALSSVLQPNGLAFVSAWYSLELLDRSIEDEKQAIQPHLDLLKAMGCSVCIACETSNAIHGDNAPLNDSPVLSGDDWPKFAAKVEAIAEFTASQGLALAYHHHMGTVVETPEEIDLFMDNTGPATKLLFDTGHCYFGGNGVDPSLVLQKHVDRMAHFHAKNVRPEIMKKVRKGGLSFLDGVRLGVFTVPGDPEGGVDFPACLNIAADSGYEGWLVIEAEQDPDMYNSLEYQSLGLKSLKSMAQDAGFSVR